MFSVLKEDIKAVFDRDPAARSAKLRAAEKLNT